MNMFWIGSGQSGRRASQQASQAHSAARSSRTHSEFLEKRVDRLEMVCEAMWGLLKEKLDVSDEELTRRIVELDLSDGQADGKVQRGPIDCPNCQRTNSRRHDFCIYCGQLLRTSPF